MNGAATGTRSCTATPTNSSRSPATWSPGHPSLQAFCRIRVLLRNDLRTRTRAATCTEYQPRTTGCQRSRSQSTSRQRCQPILSRIVRNTKQISSSFISLLFDLGQLKKECFPFGRALNAQLFQVLSKESFSLPIQKNVQKPNLIIELKERRQVNFLSIEDRLKSLEANFGQNCCQAWL